MVARRQFASPLARSLGPRACVRAAAASVCFRSFGSIFSSVPSVPVRSASSRPQHSLHLLKYNIYPPKLMRSCCCLPKCRDESALSRVNDHLCCLCAPHIVPSNFRSAGIIATCRTGDVCMRQRHCTEAKIVKMSKA